MLTPAEISGKVFEKSLFQGYHAQSVDDFIELVTADYAALYKENSVLKRNMKVLVEKIEQYRTTESSMRAALLAAQTHADSVIEAANQESAKIIDDANRERTDILARADADVRARLRGFIEQQAVEEEKLRLAREKTAEFIAESEALTVRHAEFLLSLENIRNIVTVAARDETPPPPDDVPEEAPPENFAAPEEPVPGVVYPSEEDILNSNSKFDYENLKFGVNFTQE